MKIERRPKKYSLQITTERHQRRRIPDGWQQTVPCTCRSHWKGNSILILYWQKTNWNFMYKSTGILWFSNVPAASGDIWKSGILMYSLMTYCMLTVEDSAVPTLNPKGDWHLLREGVRNPVSLVHSCCPPYRVISNTFTLSGTEWPYLCWGGVKTTHSLNPHVGNA